MINSRVKSVLLVEDNPANMDLATDLLEMAGWRVVQATTAEVALDLAALEPYDLILMDVSLPGIDGLEATRRLKQHPQTASIPVAALTAQAMPGDREAAFSAGCVGYIAKPIDTRRFAQTVAAFLGQEGGDFIGERKRILIVDDEPANRDLLEALLTGMGHETESAADGYKALAQLRLDFDLILLDVMMPNMDGFEVTRRIRGGTECPDIPICMVTTLSGMEERLRAVEAGANDFIAKPVDKTELKVRTESLLKTKEAQDALKHHQAELEETVARRTESLRQALQKMVEAQRRTQQAQLETIDRLALAAELKDEDTALHIKRMSQYCLLLARGLKLSPQECEMLLHASPMHDVGKIGIPDAILLKPGKLDAAEWQIMRTHTEIGARILGESTSELLRAGEIVARTHHEKWDGSGYPSGLSGEAIPLWGRIAAVADVFDALTSKRPYKEPFSTEKALQIMREGRATHFDPVVLDVFFEYLDDVLAIKERYRDLATAEPSAQPPNEE